MDQQAVVVQILTYRTPGIEGELDRLFDSLARVQAPPGGWAIVILDNPSPLGNLEQYLRTAVLPRVGVDLPPVTVQSNATNTGFAGGHEDGLLLSRLYAPTYVYLLNQDTHVAPDFLVQSVAAAEAQPRAALMQSRIMLGQDATRLNTCGNALHMLGFGFTLGNGNVYVPERDYARQRHGLPMFYASGAGVLLRVAMLGMIGGMFAPSYFMYHEDVDISWRTRLAGLEVGYAGDSVVYHHYEFSRSMQKFYWMERNRHLTNLVNYRIPTLLLLLPGMCVMEAGTLLFSFRSGWFKEKLRSWMFFARLSTWRFIVERRAHIRALRVVGDREILSHMTGMITSQEVRNPIMEHVVNPFFMGYHALLRIVVRW